MNFAKHKNTYIRKKVTVAALCCAALVAFLTPFLTSAQTAGPEPRGRVLQATTNTCPSLWRVADQGLYAFNALTVTASKTSAAFGENIELAYSVKPECASEIVNAPSYVVGLYHGDFAEARRNRVQFGSIENLPVKGSVPLLVSSNNFAPGDHQISVVLEMPQKVNSLSAYRAYLVGTVTITVSAAAATGDAKLVASFVSSGLSDDSPYYEYGFSYTPGSAQIAAKSVSVDCGGGTLKGTNPIPYGTGAANARCEYSKPTDGQPKDYTITFKALDEKGQSIPGAETYAKVTVTGKESNSTSQVVDKNGNPILWVVNVLIGGIMKAVVEILHLGAVTVGSLMEKVLSIHTFSDDFAQTIYPAWEIFRNLGNIVFILAIVAIGVATVFRISGYAVKDLLVKLILGAIFINFSLSIAQAVLGISDTLQQQFLSDNSGALRSIINTLFVSNVWSNVPDATLGDFASTARIMAQFFISFAAFFAILGIGILICVRLVMLWLLLMLSPIPYVAMVLPSTRKYSSQWWSQFINWAAVTPAVGFMLNLTALMTTKNRDVIEKLTEKTQLTQSSEWLNSVAFAIATNVIPLIFLYMTLQVAQSFGKGAGSFATKSLNKVTGMAFAPAAAMGGYAVGAAKAGVDKAKDKAKIGYLDKVTNYLGPKDESDVKGFKGFVKSNAFNLATGGSVWEANKKKRKGDVADKQALVGAYAKDARSLAKGETPKAVQALKDSELAKAQKDKKEDIRDNTAAENTQRLADVLNSAASSFGKTVEMLARTDLALEKGSFDDLKRAAVIQYLEKKGRGTGPGAAAAAAEAAALVADPKRSASIEHFYEAGAAAGMSRRHLEQLRDKVNAKMISDGKLDNVIDPIEVVMVDGDAKSTKREFATTPTHSIVPGGPPVLTDAEQNSKFRKKRWEKKSVQEQASSMHADMFTDPVLVASFMAKWSKLAPRKKDDAVAAMSSEKIKKIEDLYATRRAQLDAELGGYSLPTGATVTSVLDEFKTKAGF